MRPALACWRPNDPKRLQLLHELVPQAATVGVLMNPSEASSAQDLNDMKAAANIIGQHLVILNAGTQAELASSFASLRQQGIGALLITTNPYFEGRRDEIAAMAAQYAVPALYPWREYVDAGGLISYGTNFLESYHQAGLYAGRILKGAKPADLPVVQPTRFELVINLITAKALGLTVPASLQVAADDVIE